MAYRSTPPTRGTTFSPYFLVFGREMMLPIDTTLTPKDNLFNNNKRTFVQYYEKSGFGTKNCKGKYRKQPIQLQTVSGYNVQKSQ